MSASVEHLPSFRRSRPNCTLYAAARGTQIATHIKPAALWGAPPAAGSRIFTTKRHTSARHAARAADGTTPSRPYSIATTTGVTASFAVWYQAMGLSCRLILFSGVTEPMSKHMARKSRSVWSGRPTSSVGTSAGISRFSSARQPQEVT